MSHEAVKQLLKGQGIVFKRNKDLKQAIKRAEQHKKNNTSLFHKVKDTAWNILKKLGKWTAKHVDEIAAAALSGAALYASSSIKEHYESWMDSSDAKPSLDPVAPLPIAMPVDQEILIHDPYLRNTQKIQIMNPIELLPPIQEMKRPEFIEVEMKTVPSIAAHGFGQSDTPLSVQQQLGPQGVLDQPMRNDNIPLIDQTLIRVRHSKRPTRDFEWKQRKRRNIHSSQQKRKH